MSEKRFTIDKIFKEYPKLRDNETECFYHLVDNERNAEIFCERLNNLVEENEQLKKRNKFLEEFDGRAKTVANLKVENEQLRTQLLICQQSKNDDGRFQVWQVPPIRRGMRVSTTTIDNEQKRDSKRWRWSE